MQTLNGSTARGGIDLGGTKIQAVVVGPDGAVRGAARRPTPQDGGAQGVVEGLVGALREAADAAGTEVRALGGVGVGTPGAVDAARGTVSGARNLPGFDGDVPLAGLLGQATGLAVRLGNDVGVALEAEAHLGAGADVRAFLGLWWGTGVGGGLVVDRRRWLGRGAAGEIGHTVVRFGGRLCPCGRHGCVEAYAGRRALELRARKLVERGRRTKLFRIAEKKGLDRLTSGVWAKALEQGDPLAERLIGQAVRALAAGAASAVNLLDVEAVVVGGGLGSRLGEPCAARIAAAMQPHLFRPERPPLVCVSKLGDLAGAVGAALLGERA
jgi:glucokinase